MVGIAVISLQANLGIIDIFLEIWNQTNLR